MKKLLFQILIGIAGLSLIAGCASPDKIFKQLKDDPAVVTLDVVSPSFGTLHLVRVGGTNRSMTVSRDGSVTVGTVPATQIVVPPGFAIQDSERLVAPVAAPKSK